MAQKNIYKIRYFFSRTGFAVFCFFLFDCQIDSEFEYMSSRDLLVVNGLLSPDSIISISVTKAGTSPISREQFEVVEQAEVELFENGDFLGVAAYNSVLKRYILNYYPKPGESYSIAVNVSNYPELNASTNIPKTANITGCYTLNTNSYCTGCRSIEANMYIEDLIQGSTLWFTCYSVHYKEVRNEDYTVSIDSTQTQRSSFAYLRSRSHLPDQFNAIRDRGEISYQVYMRLESNTYTPNSLELDISNRGENYFYNYDEIQRLDEGLGLYMVAMASSDEFDHYLKGIIINNFNDRELIDDFPNPFAERVEIYSNIENGLGIFAGYNPVVIPIHETECEY